MLRIDVITPFPEMLRGFFEHSMVKRAQDKGLADIRFCDLRLFATDKHKTVDDYPYGGGAGMILKPAPIFRAVESCLKSNPEGMARIIYPSPQGSQFNQQKAEELSQAGHVIFICGHYRGVDERVIEDLVTEEISIGDFVLSGGELASAVIIDAAVRLIPGVLGDMDSADGDSFSGNRLDHPHYTRPRRYRGIQVPEVLLSGHHDRIDIWRERESISRTIKKRPDLMIGKKSKKNKGE